MRKSRSLRLWAIFWGVLALIGIITDNYYAGPDMVIAVVCIVGADIIERIGEDVNP